MHYARHRQVGEVYTHGMFTLKSWLELLILAIYLYLPGVYCGPTRSSTR